MPHRRRRLFTAAMAALSLSVAAVTETAAQTVTLSASPTALAEGDGATDITVTASVSPAQGTATTVTLTLAGTARASDYTVGALPSITIPANETSGSATAVLSPVDDDFWENAETIVVNGSVGDLTVTSASVTLNDDEDPPTLEWTIPVVVPVIEGHSRTIVSTLSLRGAAFEDDVVATTTLASSSTASTADFTITPALPLTSTLRGGARTLPVTWTVAAVDDTDEEDNESIDVRSTLTHLGRAMQAETHFYR